MLSIDDVTIRYEARTVLRKINLSVNAGEVVALIGPNGVGKSTLIRACSGTLKPIGGRVTIDGQDLHRLGVADRARLIAVVPQAVRLPESFSVFETVLMGRTPYLGSLGRESEKDQSAEEAALDRTGTLELAERPIGEISGGEQQRVLIGSSAAGTVTAGPWSPLMASTAMTTDCVIRRTRDRPRRADYSPLSSTTGVSMTFLPR